MATAVKERKVVEANDIVTIVEANPVMVLTDREKFDQFYEAIKRETDALEIDLTTEKGRKAIKSMAYKVAQTKTAIDKAGKQLNEEARARINAVDESRREIWDRLEALQTEVRAPLTEWEAAEEARVTSCNAVIESLRAAALVSPGTTAADISEAIATVEAEKIDGVRFKDLTDVAETLKEQTLATLAAELERATIAEAERAELERLRAEAAERERIDQEKAEAAEAERLAAQAAADEAARIEAAAKAAEDAARATAEQKATEEKAAADRAHAEALEAERRRANEAEAARLADQAAAQRATDEQAAREADQAHRVTVLRAAKEAIMAAGPVEEPVAKAIVRAIAAGTIPRVGISF